MHNVRVGDANNALSGRVIDSSNMHSTIKMICSSSWRREKSGPDGPVSCTADRSSPTVGFAGCEEKTSQVKLSKPDHSGMTGRTGARTYFQIQTARRHATPGLRTNCPGLHQGEPTSHQT